nr:ABC transporter permease [Ardenticatena sp.]
MNEHVFSTFHAESMDDWENVPQGKWLTDMWHVMMRTLRLSWGMPIWIVLSAVYPLIWLVLFGSLFEQMSLPSEIGVTTYLEFFVPGMIVATTIFSSLWAGFGIILDLGSGMLKRILSSPVSHSATAIGYVLASQSGVVVQIALIIAVAWWMGARLHLTWLSGMAAFAVVMLLSIGLSAFSHMLAVLLRRQEPLITIANFLSLPLLFLASILMPATLAPEWVRSLMWANPVHHTVEIIRVLVLPGYQLTSSPWVHLALLGVFVTSMLVLLFVVFRRVE